MDLVVERSLLGASLLIVYGIIRLDFPVINQVIIYLSPDSEAVSGPLRTLVYLHQPMRVRSEPHQVRYGVGWSVRERHRS